MSDPKRASRLRDLALGCLGALDRECPPDALLLDVLAKARTELREQAKAKKGDPAADDDEQELPARVQLRVATLGLAFAVDAAQEAPRELFEESVKASKAPHMLEALDPEFWEKVVEVAKEAAPHLRALERLEVAAVDAKASARLMAQRNDLARSVRDRFDDLTELFDGLATICDSSAGLANELLSSGALGRKSRSRLGVPLLVGLDEDSFRWAVLDQLEGLGRAGVSRKVRGEIWCSGRSVEDAEDTYRTALNRRNASDKSRSGLVAKK